MTEPAPESGIEDGIALCLSGGGYRAMVFHLGALWRLNELGLLKKLIRVSSVSGGSITAGALALHWKDLDFGPDGVARRLDRVIDAVRGLAGETIDQDSIVSGIFSSDTISERVSKAYDKHLFHGATLQDLPQEVPGESPRFVINAANVQTGALFRFSPKYMADYRIGQVRRPKVRLADAVTASSAFPPVLSPMTLKIRQPMEKLEGADLHKQPYISKAVLSDGGVYDNLGLETALGRCRTLLVSNAGQKLTPETKPKGDWIRHSIRVIGLIDNQVRSLRKRNLIEEFISRDRHDGTYWGIGTDFEDYGLSEDPLGCADRDPRRLAETPTRLKAIGNVLQEKLINWGYAICDASLRRYFDEELQSRYGVTITLPEKFPYKRGY
ncbi:MAG: patatin-like phospholipase family protein [Pseudomonadota bacterium]